MSQDAFQSPCPRQLEEGQLDCEKLGNYKRIKMTDSHIKKYEEFLSRPTSTIGEKYLKKSEVARIIKHNENAVQKLLSDPHFVLHVQHLFFHDTKSL